MSIRYVPLLFFIGCIPFSYAEKLTEGAAIPVSGVSMGTMGSMLLALIFVIVLIFASTWLIKYINPRLRGGSIIHGMNIKGTMYLGKSERLVIVEVQGECLLLGVTSGGITLLQKMDTPAEDLSAQGTLFSQLLHKKDKKKTLDKA